VERLLQGPITSIQPAAAPELEVLQAVVAHFSRAETGKCEIARVTYSRPDRWAAARKPTTRWLVSSVESPAPMPIPDDLLIAIERANQHVASLEGLRVAEGLMLAATEESAADCVIRLSRPGVAAEGNRAVVDIHIGSPPCRCPSGHILYLEKRRGSWFVAAEGGHWTTECVCVRSGNRSKNPPGPPLTFALILRCSCAGMKPLVKQMFSGSLRAAEVRKGRSRAQPRKDPAGS
jgi:hypothetical protein